MQPKKMQLDFAVPQGWVCFHDCTTVEEIIAKMPNAPNDEQVWSELEALQDGLSSIHSRFPGVQDGLLYELVDHLYLIGHNRNTPLWDDAGHIVISELGPASLLVERQKRKKTRR